MKRGDARLWVGPSWQCRSHTGVTEVMGSEGIVSKYSHYGGRQVSSQASPHPGRQLFLGGSKEALLCSALFVHGRDVPLGGAHRLLELVRGDCQVAAEALVGTRDLPYHLLEFATHLHKPTFRELGISNSLLTDIPQLRFDSLPISLQLLDRRRSTFRGF